jgi:hypothetical protein
MGFSTTDLKMAASVGDRWGHGHHGCCAVFGDWNGRHRGSTSSAHRPVAIGSPDLDAISRKCAAEPIKPLKRMVGRRRPPTA